MKKAYVLCCNKNVELVYIGKKKKAKVKLNKLRRDHYNNFKYMYNRGWKCYKVECNWNLYEIEYEIEE